jgi:hypothetical protein
MAAPNPNANAQRPSTATLDLAIQALTCVRREGGPFWFLEQRRCAFDGATGAGLDDHTGLGRLLLLESTCGLPCSPLLAAPALAPALLALLGKQ